MNQRLMVGAAVLFGVVILGMFGYAYVKNQSMQKETQVSSEAQDEPMTSTITAKHFFENGTHTIVGEVLLPTPCDLLEAEAIVRESSPEQVTIALSVINHSEVCAQVVTTQRFRVDFETSEDAQINATLRGESMKLNLIPPAKGETPDDFEIFIKG